MTCKDCLLFEKCLELGEVDINASGGNHICKHFKNKNGYVKLPCEVGNTVYIIRDWPCVDICKGCEHFKQSEMDVLSECGKNKLSEDECYPDCIAIKKEEDVDLNRIIGLMHTRLFGRGAYLTYEEAERHIERVKERYNKVYTNETLD